jgi:hypothetical protein
LSTIAESGSPAAVYRGYPSTNTNLNTPEARVRKAARKWVLKALDREFKEENELLEHMQSNLEGWDPIRGVYRFSNNAPLRVGPRVRSEEIRARAASFQRGVSLRSAEEHHLYGGSALNEVPHYVEVTNGYARAKMEKLQSRRGSKMLQRRKSHQQLIDLVKNAISKPDLEEALKRLGCYQKKIVQNNFNFTMATTPVKSI